MSFAINTNEDEDDFTPSTNSNLASIFQESGPTQLSTKSLIYTAPKQPTNNKPQSPMAASSPQSVAAATAVTCYRLNNDKYEPLPGKIGLALLSNHDTKMYTMILYQNKQKPMASVRITAEFSLTSQPDNFCSFYDDQRQNWAVLFDSKDVSQNFLLEIDKMKSLLGRDGKPSSTASVKDPSSAPSSSDRLDGASMNSSHSTNSPAVNNNLPITESQKTKLISRIAKLGQPILPLKGAAVAEESGSEQLQSSPEPPEPVLERSNHKPNKKFSRPVPAVRPNVIAPPMNETNNFNVNTMALSSSSQFHPYHQQAFPVMQYVPAFSGTTSVGNSNHFDILLSETRTQNSEIRMNLCRLTDKVDLALQKNTGFELQPVMRTSDISREPEMVAHLQKLQSQASGQSDKLDRILEWITSQEQSRQITNNTQHNSAELSELWATKEREAEASIQHLKTENSRLLKQWEEAIQQRDDSIQENVKLKSTASSMQTLEEENSKLKTLLKEKEVALEQNNRLSSASEKLKEEEDERISRLKEENARLSDLLESVRKEKNLAEIQLEEKLVIYQSKCGEMESHLRELKSLVGEKEEAVQELQSNNNRLERDALDSRNLADTLKSKLEASENKPRDDGTAVEEQVKIIMNKLYKQALKQFQPEESYSFQNIKASLSTVIRDVTLAVLNGEALQSTSSVSLPKAEPVPAIQVVPIEEVSSKDPVIEDTVTHDVEATTIIAASSPLNGETSSLIEEEHLASNKLDSEEGNKGRSVSFLETLHNTLAAAQSHHEPTWKPDPPPPPLFDDFEEDDDDWLA